MCVNVRLLIYVDHLDELDNCSSSKHDECLNDNSLQTDRCLETADSHGNRLVYY